jgi:hypothetical protein
MQWENNFEASDADSFLKLNLEQKQNHVEVKKLKNKFRDLTDNEAIAFHQIKILDKQGYLFKFQHYCYQMSIEDGQVKEVEYNFPKLTCQIYESYHAISKIV